MNVATQQLIKKMEADIAELKALLSADPNSLVGRVALLEAALALDAQRKILSLKRA